MLTYINLKGLEGHSEASWNWRVDPECLFDDTTGVLHLLQGLDVQTLEVHPLLFLEEDTNSEKREGRQTLNSITKRSLNGIILSSFHYNIAPSV